MSQKISGGLLSYASIFGNVFIALLVTPLMVSSLGQGGYGLLSIAIAFMAYLNMLDFGMNDSLMRYFVAHRGDREATRRFLGRMICVYSVVGILILLMGQGLAALFPVIFAATMSEAEISLLQAMIQVMSVGAAVLIGLNPVNALIYAHERFVYMRSVEMLVSWGGTLVIVAALLLGQGPLTVAIITAGGKVVQALLGVSYLLIFLKIPIRPLLPDLAELRVVLKYAAPIFVSLVAGQAVTKLDNILVGAILGAAPVAIYAIGLTFNKYLQAFSTAVSRLFTPEIIRKMDKGADPVQLTDMMIRISRIQAMSLFLVLGGLIVFGQRFLTLWLGPEFAPAYFIMITILSAFVLNLTGNSRNVVLQVRGLYWYKSLIFLIMALVNIPLTIVLLKTWGLIGAAASTAFAIILGYFLLSAVLRYRVGLSMVRYWRESARRILPIFAVLLVAGLVFERWLPEGWLGLMAGAALFTVAYVLAMVGLASNDYERALFRKILTQLGVRVRLPILG